MSAKLTKPGPLNFGTIPGFGISENVWLDVYDTFVSTFDGNDDRFVTCGVGFGDHISQVATSCGFEDAGLFPSAYVEDLSATGVRYERPRQPDHRFANGIQAFAIRRGGIAFPVTTLGDDGIDCYDAAPDGSSYEALYLGNRCQSYVGYFGTSDFQNPDQVDASNQAWASPSSPVTYTNHGTNVSFTPGQARLGYAQVIIIFETGVSAPTASSATPGWHVYPIPPDASGYAATLFVKVTTDERLGTEALQARFGPTTGTIVFAETVYSFVDPDNPVEAITMLPVDGGASTGPSVTSTAPGSTAITCIMKNTSAGWTIPPGWNDLGVGANRRYTTGAWVGATIGVSDRNLTTTGSASGAPVWSGAGIGGIGVAFTFSLRRATGVVNTLSGPGNLSVVGVGFQPDLLLFNLCDPVGFSDNSGGWYMVGATDGTNQWVVAEKTALGSGPTLLGGILNQTVRYRRFRTDACVHFIGSPSQFVTPTPNDVTASIVSMDTDGFTLNFSDLTGYAYVSFMAVKINPGAGGVKVGSGTQPGGTGAQSFSGLGFQPQGLMFASPNVTNTAMQSTGSIMSFGLSDGLNDYGAWMESPTSPFGAGPFPAPQAFQTNTGVLVTGNISPAVIAKASVQSLDADGFTLDWTINDSVARLFGWVALAADEDPVSQPVAITDTATDIGRAGSSAFTTFHGRITPNSLPTEAVNYFFQVASNPGLSPIFSTGLTLDGSGTTEVPVTQTAIINAFFFDPTVTPFCYRIVVVTSYGCYTYGEWLCFDHAQPRLTFGNKFRIEA